MVHSLLIHSCINVRLLTNQRVEFCFFVEFHEVQKSIISLLINQYIKQLMRQTIEIQKLKEGKSERNRLNGRYYSRQWSQWLHHQYSCEKSFDFAKHFNWTKSQSINLNVLERSASNSCNQNVNLMFTISSKCLETEKSSFNSIKQNTSEHIHIRKYGENNYGNIQSKCLNIKMCVCVSIHSTPLLLAFEYCSQQSIFVSIMLIVFFSMESKENRDETTDDGKVKKKIETC